MDTTWLFEVKFSFHQYARQNTIRGKGDWRRLGSNRSNRTGTHPGGGGIKELDCKQILGLLPSTAHRVNALDQITGEMHKGF